MSTQFAIVGLTFRPAKAREVFQSLAIDETNLKLEREPTNPYDSRAIKVLTLDGVHHVGYISKTEAFYLSEVMDREPDGDFSAKLLDRTPKGGWLELV